MSAQQEAYSTGELAKACGVTVRTVQYYDEKGLLPPAQVSDGGRRIYTADDAAKLRKILLLKSLGLQLGAIRGVMDSGASGQLMQDILEEQDRKLEAEIDKRQEARKTIAAMVQGLQDDGVLPAESITGMEDIMMNDKMQEQQLKNVYATLWAVALPLGALELAALVHGIRRKDWKPFVAVELMDIPVACALVRFYRDRVAYKCPHCHAVFKPEAREWFLAAHTPTTRKVRCTSCGELDWCAEVSAGRLAQA